MYHLVMEYTLLHSTLYLIAECDIFLLLSRFLFFGVHVNFELTVDNVIDITYVDSGSVDVTW